MRRRPLNATSPPGTSMRLPKIRDCRIADGSATALPRESVGRGERHRFARSRPEFLRVADGHESTIGERSYGTQADTLHGHRRTIPPRSAHWVDIHDVAVSTLPRHSRGRPRQRSDFGPDDVADVDPGERACGCAGCRLDPARGLGPGPEPSRELRILDLHSYQGLLPHRDLTHEVALLEERTRRLDRVPARTVRQRQPYTPLPSPTAERCRKTAGCRRGEPWTQLGTAGGLIGLLILDVRPNPCPGVGRGPCRGTGHEPTGDPHITVGLRLGHSPLERFRGLPGDRRRTGRFCWRRRRLPRQRRRGRLRCCGRGRTGRLRILGGRGVTGACGEHHRPVSRRAPRRGCES